MNITNDNEAPASICIYCKHFSPGWGATRTSPAEGDDCGHPTLYALMTHNMGRGTIKKCKGFEAKRVINYRDVQNLQRDHTKSLAFDAILRREDLCMEAAGAVCATSEEGSLAEFNRHIAGDR